MKTKLVLWGENAENERVLLALQLHTNSNRVSVWSFPETVATPEFTQQMYDWRDDKPFVFPENTTHFENDLSVTESLLPEGLKAEKPELLSRAQSEWHFIVLSSKMHEALKSELAGLGDKIHSMEKYNYELWDNLKGYWDKVQNNVRDKNLFREHADELRVTSNELFDKLKVARTAISQEFEQNSKKWYENFNTKLDDIETRIKAGMNARFPQIFDQLRDTQNQFRDQKMTKDHANEVWGRIDNLFKAFKEKKYGTSNSSNPPGQDNRPKSGGLDEATAKMKASIDRDQKDLEYEQKRADNSANQLEEQLRQARINIIKDRINSKMVKYDDMVKTKAEADARAAAKKAKDDAAKAKADADKVKADAEKAAKVVATPVVPETPPVVDHVVPVAAPEVHVETPPVGDHIVPVAAPEVHDETPPVVDHVVPVAAPEVHDETPIVPEQELKITPNIMAEHDTTRMASANEPVTHGAKTSYGDHITLVQDDDVKLA